MIVNFDTLTFKWRVYSKQLQVHLQSQSFYRVNLGLNAWPKCAMVIYIYTYLVFLNITF